METIEYASSADGTRPLYADVEFTRDGRPKPLLAVMHGYNGSKEHVATDLRDLSARGVFAIAPDMRGCGKSAGRFDSNGLDVHDILDAVLAAVAKFPGEIDARNLNIVGYSGGGANAAYCAVRFPDLFRTAVSFFGFTDCAAWFRSSARVDCNVRMAQAIGGTPDEKPAEYDARNINPAAGNITATRLHFFWDQEEVQCPPDIVQEFIANHRALGLNNVFAHISRPGDERRWHHGYRTDNPDLAAADSIFLAEVLAPASASPCLPTRGRLVVPGYLVTRQFAVWIEDGQAGRATVEYDLNAQEPRVRVVESTGRFRVRIDPRTPLADLP
ncbi:MAG: alpha/beta hydrolase family protein [Phycisphaerae bacterium]